MLRLNSGFFSSTLGAKLPYRKIGIACLLNVFMWGFVAAQGVSDTTGSDQNIIERNVEISGQAGMYGELYGISGRAMRRPNATGRVFLRPSITFLNEITLNINVMLTSEGISARQNMNEIGLNPSWSWGDANAGDFSERFSNYTLSGVTIRGGGVNLYPGIFRFSAVVGRTQRPVSGGAGNKSYSRTIYGAKLGIGKESGSYIDLIFIRAKDDAGSLPSDSTLTNPGAIYSDTTMNGMGPPTNPYAITPQENLVGAVNWQLEVIPGYLSWQSEVSGSIFTRDIRSETIPYSDLNAPGIAKGLFTPRYSSNADVVVDSKMNLSLSGFSADLGYKWIGPGYRSLGTSYLINDQQEFNSRLSYRFSSASLSVNWAQVTDNLLNQKRYTSTQNRYGGTITTRFSNFWNSSYTANIVSRGNNSDNDTTRNSFNNLVLNTSQNITFSENTALQNLSVNYSYQRARSETGVRFTNTNFNHTINAALSVKIVENLSSNVSYGFIFANSSRSTSTRTNTARFGLRHRADEGKWTNGLSFSSSFRAENISLRTRFNSSYRLTDKTRMALNLSMMNFRTNNEFGTNFSEFTGSIRLSHQF